MENTFIKVNDQYYILAATVGMMDNRTVALKEGDSFSVCDKLGDIKSIGETPHGVYSNGTRYISRMEMLINDQIPFMLSSALNEQNEMHIIDLTNPDIKLPEGHLIEKGNIQIQRKKFLWHNVYYETIKLCCFSMQPVSFRLSILFDSDFKDVFEVRGMKRTKKGIYHDPEVNTNKIVLHYTGADHIRRSSRICFSPDPGYLDSGKAEYHVTLAPRECKDLFISTALETDQYKPELLMAEEAYFRMITRINNAKNQSPRIYTSNNQFNAWIKRSLSDLITLGTEMNSGLYPYAGIPWYSTPFGRDGIITAMQTLWVYPPLTKGVLRFLASTQAREHNALQDAEPGKIFHELRAGEMANTGEVPFKLYYGTIDATPLFIVLAGMYYDRTGDKELINEIWENIELALDWMDKYGDIDQDGFLEYQRKKESGLGNQGWKDSWDSIYHEDGTMAEWPIALCEVQGYAYQAKTGASRLYAMMGNKEKAEALARQAVALKEKFINSFWSEEKQTYVIALDGKKKQCHVSSSNAGHCLFSGIAAEGHVRKLVKTLLSGRMFSGWGIRTIASNEVRYNPMSYHNGSVWPHDNSIIAAGMARYGFYEEAHQIMTAMYDVSQQFESQRLPELFCGFERLSNAGVTNYPVACSPQAWAAASVYLLVQSCLRIRIKAGEHFIYFYKPTLPSFLDEMTIANLPVNDGLVTLQIKRINGQLKIEIVASHGPTVALKVMEHSYEEEYGEFLTGEILK